MRSLRAIERSDIVLVIVDTERGITIGDIKVVANAESMGRGIIFIANKWDLVKGVEQYTFRQSIYEKTPSLKYIDIVFTNALKGVGLDKVIQNIINVNEQFNKRISTSELNTFLENIVKEKHPPAKGGKFIKFYYITQAERKPPTFIIFCNFPKHIDEPYQRYIVNKLRQEYGFRGAPLLIFFKPRKKA